VAGELALASRVPSKIPGIYPELCYAFAQDFRSCAAPATLREAIFPQAGVKCPEGRAEIF
jgi:hypothetical protein